jgi:hypothetical protein
MERGQHRTPNRNKPRNENFLCAGGAVRLTGSRGLTRWCHRPPAIKRHLLEQAAMFIAADVRFAAHYGLKPDSEPSPKSAQVCDIALHFSLENFAKKTTKNGPRRRRWLGRL